MRKEALNSVRAAIEANTERRSLEQLQAQGKRHVRVVSGEKILEIIKAIVGDIVDREVGELSKRDRDRIVHETKTQFDRVLKLQNDQDAIVREQRELLAEHKTKVERLERERDALHARLEKDRAEQSAREAKILAEYQERLASLSHQQGSQAQLVSDLEGRLAKSKATIQNYDENIVRLTAQAEGERQEKLQALRERDALRDAHAGAERAAAALEHEIGTVRARCAADLETTRVEAERALDAQRQELLGLAERSRRDGDLLERMKEALQGKELEVQRLTGERDTLRAELDAARQQAGESAGVSALRGELAEMKSFLRTLDERAGKVDESTVQTLLAQLAQRESVNSSAMEERFSATLDKTIDQIAKTMAAATARPIDVAVEATDVVVDRLFDLDGEMKTNLEQLDVEVRTSKSGIGGNLARLKAMRMGGKASAPEAPPEEPAEGEPVAPPAKKPASSSMERLKAVRESSPARKTE